ncbi:MAG: hypothetical protein EXS15_05085 [Phycisphaerales bacterium]|nr:hypothetical protein [Phycisphaerales bacterium]
MINQNTCVLVTEALAMEPLAWLQSQCRVIESQPGSPGFDAAAHLASGIVVRTYTTVDETLLARLPLLKVVGRAGVGVDNIDLKACAKRGVIVVNTPDANTQAVVEYVTCLIGDALRPRVFLDRALTLEAWEQVRSATAAPRQMSELTLGIMGLGRIGRRIADVARAIGFRVIYNDLVEIPHSERAGATPVDAQHLFRESNVISIHIDGRPSNRHFVAGGLIGAMRDDGVLINTSRGMVLQSDALALFLAANASARAILDVHDPEPFTEHSPLLHLPNAFLAPHLASRTTTAMTNMSWVVKDVIAVIEGRSPSASVVLS